MKKYLPLLAAGIFAAALAFAGPIVTWSSGDTITANDLSANFTHIHATMVGAHGPRLVNSDVSATAAISHSKLATPSLIPKAWGTINAYSDGGISVAASSGVSSAAYSGTGQYTVNLSTARSNAVYGVVVSAQTGGSGHCGYDSRTTSSFTVQCILVPVDGGVAALSDFPFSFVLMDDN